MCGRFTAGQGPEDVFSETGLSPPIDWRPHFNIAPSQDVLALRVGERGHHELATLKWGLVPSWAHDHTVGRRMVMARAETIDVTSAYRDAFERRRCALISDGFFEWRREGGGSTPFYYRFTKRLFIAAIWERWRKRGHDIESCALVTTDANRAVTPVHDRMPVLLDASAADIWLNPEAPMSAVRSLLRPAPEEFVRVFAANKAVNNPANDSRALLGDFDEEARLFGEVAS